jgi:hypothetical protein
MNYSLPYLLWSSQDDTERLACGNATRLTGIQWTYLKVAQREYEILHPSDFKELMEAFSK